MLFALATHPDRTTRNAAILTLKRWAPETPVLGDAVLRFALVLLRRAEVAPLEPAPAVVEEKPAVEAEAGGDAEMVDGEEEKTRPRHEFNSIRCLLCSGLGSVRRSSLG